MQNSLFGLLAASAVLFSASPAASAQTLADWDFSGLDYTGGTNIPVVNPILPNTTCALAAGLTVTDLTADKVMASYEGLNWFQHAGGGNYPGMAPLRRFDGDNSNTSTFHDGIVDNYVAFTLSSTAPGGLNIGGLRVNTYRFGTGAPIKVGFEVVVDGGTPFLFGGGFQDDLNSGDNMPDWFDFSDTIMGATDVEVRLQYIAAPGGTGTGPMFIAGIQVDPIGSSSTAFCDPAAVNCNGGSTTISGSFGTGIGSGLHLSATNGPSDEFGYFLVSSGMSSPGIMLSNGNFCLSDGVNPFGRYNIMGVQNSVGQFSSDGLTFTNFVGTGTSAGGTGFDVPATIPISGSPTIMAGETWNFQLWHRDACVTVGASNFSNGLSVTF